MRFRDNAATLGALSVAGVIAFGLTACMQDAREPLAELPPASVADTQLTNLVADEPVKIGDPYDVAGKSYAPQAVKSYDEVGYASWYGDDFEGKATANGETFASARISAAHKTLPLPTYAEVTSLKSGETILVRINDRGPFSNDRIIDLSKAAATQLGITQDGHAAVRVRMVNPPVSERMALRRGERIVARIPTSETLLTILRKKLSEQEGTKLAVVSTDIPASTAKQADVVPASTVQASTVQANAAPPTKAAVTDKQAASREAQELASQQAAVVAAAAADKAARPSRRRPPARGESAPVTVATNIAAAPAIKATPTSAAPSTTSARRGSLLVQVGAFANKSNADATANRMGGNISSGGRYYRVRTGPYANLAEANKGVARARANGYPDASIVRAD